MSITVIAWHALLENQAKELLREASTMAGGDVEGFAAVAFPIVRRVFGGLVANELVSVQPMSLPSGLIFFLDFTTANGKLGYEACDSIYGGGVVGSQITGGVDLSTTDSSEDGFYNLNNGYAATTGSCLLDCYGYAFSRLVVRGSDHWLQVERRLEFGPATPQEL